MYIPRKRLITHWLNENCKARHWGEYGKWKEEADKIRPKFNVSLTRSIVNLRSKGLVRTFNISRPSLTMWAFRDAARQAQLSRGMKRMAGENADEEDKVLAIYNAAKEANRKGLVSFREVGAGDKFFASIQIVGLTAKGKEIALNANDAESQKISSKEQAKT